MSEKKPVVAFTIADKNNLPYAQKLRNSLRKWHSEEEMPFIIYEPKPFELKRDPHFYYRAAPYYAKELIKDYDLVIKLDADQLVTGDLGHILDATEVDVGTVLNWNRIDPATYGLVQVWDIGPDRYMNAGLVAMRSQEFVEHWWKLCTSDHFEKYPYKEQDLLNILVHYGNYKWECFDWGDTFNGLVSKGDWPRCYLEEGKLVLDPDEAGFPEQRKTIKVIHWAGGQGSEKQNYRINFSEPVVEWMDWLISNEQGQKA